MKKGFTLIELLAVILILGIIALIAIPTVTNIIEEARRGAFETSVKEILKLADEQFAVEVMKDGSVSNKNFDFDNDKGGLDYKGSDFTSGTVEVDNDGSVAVNITDGRYCANGSSSNLVITTENCTTEVVVYEPGRAVYFNPETGTKCTEAEATVEIGAKTGCLKWYTLAETNDRTTEVDVILAHNTTPDCQWNDNDESDIPNIANSNLANDTATWKTNLNVRLPDANEIARIVGADVALNWNSETSSWGEWYYFQGSVTGSWRSAASGQGNAKFAWLFDYLKSCTSYGCNVAADTSNYGYWTSSTVLPASGLGNMAWYVEKDGSMSRVSRESTAGIRPVITIRGAL